MAWELKSIPRFLIRYGTVVFIPWLFIGVLLGSGRIITAMALVMSLWFGTGFFIEGYLDIRSELRRERYLGAVIDFIFYGFGLMIALVTIYVIVKEVILRK
jgi:hypothetical protein